MRRSLARSVAAESAILSAHTLLLVLPPVCAGANPGRLLDPACVTFLVGANLLSSLERSARPRSMEESRRQPLDGAGILATATGLALLLVFWTSLVAHGAAEPGASHALGPIALAGGVLMAIGITLRWSAIRTLGDCFVSRPEVWPHQSRVVRRGPYRYLRHPSETGLLLLSIGASLLLGSVGGLVLTSVVLLPLSVARVRIEERVLRHEFGRPYREYAQAVGGWLPRIDRLRVWQSVGEGGDPKGI